MLNFIGTKCCLFVAFGAAHISWDRVVWWGLECDTPKKNGVFFLGGARGLPQKMKGKVGGGGGEGVERNSEIKKKKVEKIAGVTSRLFWRGIGHPKKIFLREVM